MTALLAVVLGACAACGGSTSHKVAHNICPDGSRQTTSSPCAHLPSASATRPAPSTPAATNASPTPAGATTKLYIADCANQYQPKIATADPATKTVSAWQDITPQATNSNLQLLPSPCGQMPDGDDVTTGYNPTFTDVGAVLMKSDDSSDAGIVDVATGAFTNLARSLHHTGFSSDAVTDQPLGFTPNADYYFTSGDDTYRSTPPYQAIARVPATIPVASPHGTFTFTVTDIAATPTTLLKLPRGKRNIVGDQSFDPAYAELAIGQKQDDIGCENPRWQGGSTLLCYSPGRLGVTKGAELLVNLKHASVTRYHDSSCDRRVDPCYQKYVWQVPTDALANLLPTNTRQNADFIPSPDGSSVVFVSSLGDTTTLETTELPTNGTPARPVPLLLKAIAGDHGIVPVSWV